MKMHKQLIPVLAVVMAGAGVAQAEVWNGAGDGVSYEDPLNWNPSTNAFAGSTRDINGAFTVNRNVDVSVNRTFVRGGATLNIASGTHSDGQSGNTVRNFVGDNAGAATVNQSGGSYNIGHILLVASGGSGGNGTYNLSGGDLSVSRGGNSFMGVSGGDSIEVGVGAGSGLFEITGGSLQTRIGVGVGANGTFSVLGSAATSIGIGSNSSLDGKWNQRAGGTLKVGIDAGGLTPIFIDDKAQGVVEAVFDSGSVLDVDYYNGGSGNGTWVVMELENGDIVDNGLALSAASQTAGWTYNVDNTGANGILTVSIPEPATLGLIGLASAGLFIVRRFQI